MMKIGKAASWLALAVGLSAAAGVAETIPAFNLWRQPQLWPRHMQLRGEFLNAVRRGDTKAMEASSRAGTELMSEDPTWRYNHACALAYREDASGALAELELAVRLGFRDADAIEKDQDFARVNTLPRFKELVELARKLQKEPVPGRPEIFPAYGHFGGSVTLNVTNINWNFDTGLFETRILLAGDNNPSPLAARYGQSRPKPNDCPERSLVSAWISEGTGAGNGGDFYFNRDRNHSPLAWTDFPLLSDVRLPAECRPFDTDVDLPNMVFKDSPPIFGNASRARTSGPFWRSDARAAMTEPHAAARMNAFYLDNQFWIFPAHKDFGREGIGDVFSSVAPFMFVTLGSSYTDQPFLRSALAASASFPRPTKQAITRRHLMAPTLQWLFRSTLKGVGGERDYLSSKAHPVAFSGERLDVVRMVERAHRLRPSEVPPVAALALVNSKMFPVKLPQPIRDFPDPTGEMYYVTPTAISIVLRGLEAERTFLVQARAWPEQDPTASFAWKVVGGDASAVKITPPLGETLASPETGLAQITIDRSHVTNRIDIAVFARSHGTEFGAPSFISFYPVPFERRVYDASKRLVSIDNSDLSRYTDPYVALPRPWKDVFKYAPDGRLLGYVRYLGGKPAAEFTATGERIVEKNADGSAKKVVKIRYLARGNRAVSNLNLPPNLTYLDEGEPYDYRP